MAKPQTQNSNSNHSSSRKSVSRGSSQQTRTATQTNGSNDDDDDDDDPVDEDLCAFLEAPPAIADHVLVVAASPSGDAIVQDRTATEAKRGANALAAQITIACERWAQSERRIVRFRASWLKGDKVLATHAWECGEKSGGELQLDGSTASFLQQQQMFAQAQHKLHLEGFEMVQEGWQKLLTLQNKRIEALEKDNAELRDRLRKLDEVGSDLQVESMKAEIEARGRTADLIEKRVLPIVQAVAIKHLQSSTTVPLDSNHENGEKK